jgi:rod shape determining protein RodA
MELRFERRMLTHVPWVLVLAVVLTTAIGIYNLASASRTPEGSIMSAEAATHLPMWASQALYFVLGVAIVVVIAFIDNRLIQSLSIPIYLVNIAMLIGLKFIGHKAKGAESWFVLGPLRLQPAEFMKIGMVLMMAKYFHDDYKPNAPTYGFLRLIPPAAIAVVPTLMVLVQPDLGTALMMAFTTITILLFARPKLPVLIVMGLAGVLTLGILWNDYVRVQPEPRVTIIRHHLKKHQDGRISGWLDPTSDLKGSNYHAMQSKIAVGSGGMGGKGWMEGTQTGLRYLPEQHTDFIFSVWAEEQGYFKCLFLLVLYGVMLLAALSVSLTARDRFGAFVGVGIAAMIFWQVFENIGMVTGLLPITGITLPLMSYGGSSMISVMIGVGLLVNIGMRRHVFSR